MRPSRHIINHPPTSAQRTPNPDTPHVEETTPPRSSPDTAMTNDDILTDDYVADLLAKDAGDCAIKYSAMGMDAFRSDKKCAQPPSPG